MSNTKFQASNQQINIPFLYALLPVIVMVVAMAVSIIKFEASPHVPLIIGAITATLVAMKFGYRWDTIEQGIYRGIKMALPAIVIIIMIGLTIGAWLGGGIVATMIYYGLKLISPSLFLFTICIICGIVTLSIGSSWSTMGTIGVAAIGIGLSIGIPTPMVAGAVISGAYFGDKMSPLSDTTNLASGITGTDLFEHIKHMLTTTLPAYLIALSFYLYIGMQFDTSHTNLSHIQNVMENITQNFVVSPWLLLVPVIVVLLVMKKIPAIPALTIGILLGTLCHVIIQGSDVGTAVKTLHDGFKIQSGHEIIDTLFNRGGIESMMYTISLTIVAMSFGGIAEQTGMLRSVVSTILHFARNASMLIIATIFSSVVTNCTTSEQYISILLPGRMYVTAYKERKLHSKNLSRALEDGGTVTSVLVPWNTCGVYAYSMLQVSAFEYAPYAVFNYTVPLLAMMFALFNIKIERIE
ncbi:MULTISPECIES: Na+/H+ antiporter NhaC [Pasteurellaceae]|uniref:Na+/H+ antiporter NhaC n=1 Tax=Rodentibacter genomosp. 1 TaxID=1908264 RepID=A0A1V3J7U0_9PAST|nr:Na+/H+ antiporter NhaC [Rodentibacter genomosp. 1]MBF0750875.1 Na+/H+ antiporter NhaC [Pasteurella sp. 19428wF3_WM03]OOF51198.1 Na+/H+ antiporter NhaC [Rodentibacter genomosp. 1]TFU53139.1 Na+/H+ antiporter NhaC [Pasteurella sp. WM03]